MIRAQVWAGNSTITASGLPAVAALRGGAKSAASALGRHQLHVGDPLGSQHDLGGGDHGGQHAREVDVEGAHLLDLQGAEGVVGHAQQVADHPAGQHPRRPRRQLLAQRRRAADVGDAGLLEHRQRRRRAQVDPAEHGHRLLLQQRVGARGRGLRRAVGPAHLQPQGTAVDAAEVLVHVGDGGLGRLPGLGEGPDGGVLLVDHAQDDGVVGLVLAAAAAARRRQQAGDDQHGDGASRWPFCPTPPFWLQLAAYWRSSAARTGGGRYGSPDRPHHRVPAARAGGRRRLRRPGAGAGAGAPGVGRGPRGPRGGGRVRGLRVRRAAHGGRPGPAGGAGAPGRRRAVRRRRSS